MAVWNWQKTATLNATADPTMNWAEGMAPSLVNDNDRAMMARLAEYRDDISGALTTGGTSTAYTLTTNQVLATPTPTTGQLIAFVPNVTNGASATLVVDGGSAYPIQTSPGAAIGAGVLIQGSPYTAMFNGTAWLLRNMFAGNPYNVPIAGAITYFGPSAPNSSFALPFGQAISRTTYAAYFGLVGTTYGAGDGSTTFNVPDLRGRVRAGIDNMGGSAAGRIGTALVTDGGTVNGQVVGSAGGSQNHVQTNGELAAHNHTGSGNVSDPTHVHSGGNLPNAVTGQYANGGFSGQCSASGGATPAAATGITVPSLNINNAGSSNAMAWLQPTLMANIAMRII